MTLYAPIPFTDVRWMQSNFSGSRPATAAINGFTSEDVGISNVKGNWGEVLGNASAGTVLLEDAYGIEVIINDAETTGIINILFDIGIDPAGGSDFTTLVPNVLTGRCLGTYIAGGGIFYFPIKIPKGSSIGIRAQISPALGVGNKGVGVALTAFGKPTQSTIPWAGSIATSFGTNQATSGGTAVTSGTTAEGAWTLLASSIANTHYYWVPCFGVDDQSLSGVNYFADFAYGDANNKIMIIEDHLIVAEANIDAISFNKFVACQYKTVPAGANLYGRLQCSGTADSTLSLAMIGIR